MTLRRRGPRPVATALAPLREAWTPATPLAEIQAVWSEAVGPAIAAEARPVAERGGVVTVSCSSSVWAQELDLMSAAVVEAVNGRLSGRSSGGRVTALRCASGVRG